MANIYPVLKTKLILVPVGSPATLNVQFNNRNLIVSLLCPELSIELERRLNNVNLLPYELAVQRLISCDFLYNQTQVNQIGSRQLTNLDILIDNTNNGGGDCVLIVSYLEFNNE
jgi:hypothetical protein